MSKFVYEEGDLRPIGKQPLRQARNTENDAYQIVRQEELDRGWTPGSLLSQREQAREGCDFFSTPATGERPDRVEVKGWGEPLLTRDGDFTYPADLNVEQYAWAEDANWRLEIVANLTAVREGTGEIQRLSLLGSEVRKRAQPWKYKVPLDGLAEQIRSYPGRNAK